MLAYHRMVGVTNPLLARGVVLEGDFQSIVLVTVDWLGVAGRTYRHFQAILAGAVGTTPERVIVHAVHQHDAPWADADTDQLLSELGLPSYFLGIDAVECLANNLSLSIELARANAIDITQVGTGVADVEKVASARRVMGDDGRVVYGRMSSCTDAIGQLAPEGLIDPKFRLVSLWHNDQPVVGMAYYACHPQSYYRTAMADADFVGLARQRADLETGVPHLYFTGFAGNVAAGKWNDGSRAARAQLVDRLAAAYRSAWDNTQRVALSDADVNWKCVDAVLPLCVEAADRAALESVSHDANASVADRTGAVRCITLNHDLEIAPTQGLCRLTLGPADIVFGPAELFIEYQLFAQSLRPDGFVAMAGYCDQRYGYIGTAVTRREGGYESWPHVNRVADETEQVLHDALRELVVGGDAGVLGDG